MNVKYRLWAGEREKKMKNRLERKEG